MKWKEFFETVDCSKCEFEKCCTIRRDVYKRMEEDEISFEDAQRFEMETTCIIKEDTK